MYLTEKSGKFSVDTRNTSNACVSTLKKTVITEGENKRSLYKLNEWTQLNAGPYPRNIVQSREIISSDEKDKHMCPPALTELR